METCVVVELQVDVEQILPFLANDGQRLNLRQIELIERQYAEYGTEASLLVRQAEDEACLVGLLHVAQFVSLLLRGHDKGARHQLPLS